MNNIIQLKISLQWTKPPIWRRVLVDREVSFADLHLIIQAAMGWENCHLYEFDVDTKRIGEPMGELGFSEFEESLNAIELKLGDLITSLKEKFIYEYDFGDDWRHQITVEKFLPPDSSVVYPVCIAGKLNCPPEDCGGVGGYYNLIEALEDKNHPEHGDMVDWIGEDFDKGYFDKKIINTALRAL